MEMKAIPELSVDAQILVKRLQKVTPGETVTYGELSKLVKRDVQAGARSCLQSACRVVLREDQIVLAAVRTVGMKRLPANEIASVGTQAIRSIGRKSSRALRKCSCADYESLNNKERIEINTVSSMLGAVALMSKPRQVEKLEAAATQKQDKISFTETLALFSQ